MIIITRSISIKLREKRARLQLTIEETAKIIGISSKTLSFLENEKRNRVHKEIYQKVTNWLLETEMEVG